MNRKILILFCILTVAPVGLLSWLAVTSYDAEKERAADYRRSLALERLSVINSRIENYFLGLEDELVQLSDVSSFETDNLRRLTRREPLIRQIFILTEEDKLLYPSRDVPLSQQEEDFLLRTKEIGLSPGLFSGGPGTDESKQNTVPARSGWYTWYLGEGINFIYWKEHPALPGGFIGIECSRMAVISGIIQTLPATDPSEKAAFRISLVDVHDKPVYIWGNYSPPEEEEAAAVLPLSPPLTSWRLRCYAPEEDFSLSLNRGITIFGTIGALVAVIIFLAVYFYRESTREMREAYKKVNFVNQVSHELKTPLTNIRIYSELLERRIPGEDEKGRGYLDIVISESQRLSRLIGNVLTFAKDQKRGLHFSPSPAVPDEIVSRVVDHFIPALKTKSINTELSRGASKEVSLDRDILEQILNNLISNVEKYADRGGLLRIETEQSGQSEETLVITVSDNGPGIPRALRERVFQPFFRASSRTTDGVSGTGIGLSIVRTLSKLHGGRVEILNTEKGTSIRVTLSTGKPEGGPA